MAKTDNFPLKHIAELNLKITSNWRIKAKLSFTNEKTKVAPFKSGDGKICRVILEDETSKIVGISFGSLAECVASKVTHNREYYIKGAKIKNVYKTNNVGHGYELHFAEGTEFQDASNGKIICLDKKTVQSCEKKVSKAGNSSGTSRNGGLNLKPTCLREVRQASQNLLDAQKFDILAILKKTKKPEPKQNGMMKRFYRKEITLIDETGEVILSLASSKKKDFDKHSWLKSTIRVIVVKGCVWKKKGTTVYLTANLKDMIEEEKLKTPATKSRVRELKLWYCGKKKKATKGNTSKPQTAMKKQSVSKASCTITSPPVDQKGDFSKLNGNMAKSLKTKTRKPTSGVSTKKNNSGLAGKKRKSPSCSTSKGNKKHGEKLRKTDDNCVSYIDSEIFHKMQLGKQIGCIQFRGNNSCGTGFRVGSKYVITAYHVLEDIFRPFWKHVHNVLSVKERKEIKWTKDILPVAGSWNLSKLFSSLDPSKREHLLEAGKHMITKSCHIKMEFTKITGGTFLKFSDDPVAFASKKDDVLILELDDNQTLSAPLSLTEYCIPEAKLHVFGHPDNKILQHDRECRMIEDKAELAEVVKEGISFFTEKGFDSEEVKEEYATCKLSRDHILFHCSNSIAHGASGAPLVVVTDIARVFGMLQTGHPKLYYNNHCKAKPLDGRPELLLEYGISMKKVKSLLESHSLFQLSNDLFSQELSSQMTQEVETLTLD